MIATTTPPGFAAPRQRKGDRRDDRNDGGPGPQKFRPSATCGLAVCLAHSANESRNRRRRIFLMLTWGSCR